jgi:hypothetical protein
MEKPAPVLSLSEQGFIQSLEVATLRFDDSELISGEDVIDLEESTNTGLYKRPDPARMMVYKPGMEEEGQSVSVDELKFFETRALKALVKLLPECSSSAVPETDTLLKTLQLVRLPDIAVGGGLRRLDEDPALDHIRREREEGGKVGQTANLKRLLVAGAEAKDGNDDVIIKSDYLLEEERIQREFLSSLATNIHRERVYYKRYKLRV